MREASCIKYGFIIEIERWRHARFLMREYIVGAFTQRVEEQDAALPSVDLILKAFLQ